MLTLNSEASIRLTAFVGVLAVLAFFERVFPRRSPSLSKPRRWLSHLCLTGIDTLAVRFLLPVSAVYVAADAERAGYGFLHSQSMKALPDAWAMLISVLVLDLVIYLQHLMFHAVPLLWRFHRVHHADLDFDATTGIRFHPIEILISMGIKISAIHWLGPSPGSVLAFEILLNGSSLFNHGNLRIPVGLDRWLRYLIVTPDMHRVHHSIRVSEANSNFSFNFPYWDRIFGTYRAQPQAGHETMRIGLSQYQYPDVAHLGWILTNPFHGQVGGYSIESRGESSENLH